MNYAPAQGCIICQKDVNKCDSQPIHLTAPDSRIPGLSLFLTSYYIWL